MKKLVKESLNEDFGNFDFQSEVLTWDFLIDTGEKVPSYVDAAYLKAMKRFKIDVDDAGFIDSWNSDIEEAKAELDQRGIPYYEFHVNIPEDDIDDGTVILVNIKDLPVEIPRSYGRANTSDAEEYWKDKR